jgi:hypothetical protein
MGGVTALVAGSMWRPAWTAKVSMRMAASLVEGGAQG